MTPQMWSERIKTWYADHRGMLFVFLFMFNKLLYSYEVIHNSDKPPDCILCFHTIVNK